MAVPKTVVVNVLLCLICKLKFIIDTHVCVYEDSYEGFSTVHGFRCLLVVLECIHRGKVDYCLWLCFYDVNQNDKSKEMENRLVAGRG